MSISGLLSSIEQRERLAHGGSFDWKKRELEAADQRKQGLALEKIGLEQAHDRGLADANHKALYQRSLDTERVKGEYDVKHRGMANRGLMDRQELANRGAFEREQYKEGGVNRRLERQHLHERTLPVFRANKISDGMTETTTWGNVNTPEERLRGADGGIIDPSDMGHLTGKPKHRVS